MWLEVTYEGLEPPTVLFDDLRLIGWVPPTVAPPPHEAIDWSRPNEATGERFTLRSYTVAGAVVDVPRGTGARGTWTEAERAHHLAALGRVLDRHPSIEVDDPLALLQGPGATTDRPAPPPPAPVPVAAPAVAFEPSPGATAVLITAPLKPSLAPAAEDALTALGVTVVFDNQDRVKVERYRGATYETTVSELRLAAVAAPDQLDAAVASLQGLGLALSFTELDRADVASDPPASVLSSASPATAATGTAGSRPRLRPSRPVRPRHPVARGTCRSSASSCSRTPVPRRR